MGVAIQLVTRCRFAAADADLDNAVPEVMKAKWPTFGQDCVGANRIYRPSRALQFGMVAVNRTKVTGAPIPFRGDETIRAWTRGFTSGDGRIY